MNNGASSYLRFLDGDDLGLKEIIEEFRVPLQMFLFSVTGNETLSEEAAIETFVKLAVKKPAYKNKASFKTWLFTIGRNVAVDLLRKKGRDVSLDEAAEISAPGIEEAYIREEENRALHSSMKKLKAEYYSVLWLRYFEGLTVKEISQIIKKSEGSTKTTLSRARNSLKEQLEKDGYEYEIG